MLRFFTPTIPVSVKMALANGGVLFRRKALAQGRSLQSVSFAVGGISTRLVAGPGASVLYSVLLGSRIAGAERPLFSRQKRTHITKMNLTSGGVRLLVVNGCAWLRELVSTAARSSLTGILSVFVLPFVVTLPQRGWPASNVRISSVQSAESLLSKLLRGIRATRPSTAHENAASKLETRSVADQGNSTVVGRAGSSTTRLATSSGMWTPSARWCWSTGWSWSRYLGGRWSGMRKCITRTGFATTTGRRILSFGSKDSQVASASKTSLNTPAGCWSDTRRWIFRGSSSSRSALLHSPRIYSLA